MNSAAAFNVTYGIILQLCNTIFIYLTPIDSIPIPVQLLNYIICLTSPGSRRQEVLYWYHILNWDYSMGMTHIQIVYCLCHY